MKLYKNTQKYTLAFLMVINAVQICTMDNEHQVSNLQSIVTGQADDEDCILYDCIFDVKPKNAPVSLHEAFWFNDIAKIKPLLDKGANINSQTKDGRTALAIAAWKQRINTVELLLDYGADINFKGRDGLASLHTAVQTYGNICVTKLLLERGAIVDVENAKKQTPLAIVMNLIVKDYLGVIMNVENNDKRLVLLGRMSMIDTYKDKAKLLLDYGADILRVDKEILSRVGDIDPEIRIRVRQARINKMMTIIFEDSTCSIM